MNNQKRQKSTHQKRSFLVPVRPIGQVVNGTVIPSLYHRGGMWFSAMLSGDTNINIVALDTLHCVFTISAESSGAVTAIGSRDDSTVVSLDSGQLQCYERADLMWSVSTGLKECERIFVFEEFIIIVGFTDGSVQLLSRKGEMMNSFSIGKQVTAVIHPNTFLNKMLFGCSDGAVELWNVKTGSMVYRLVQDGPSVCCLAQAPDANIIAVGRADCTVTVMSIAADAKETTLGQFKLAAAPTSVAFRFDSPSNDSQMMTSDESGEVVIWSIKEKARPICRMMNAHSGPIAMAAFLVGQPIIISFGRDDNAMKEWIVESEGRECRLLRSKEGLSSPLSQTMFTSNDELVLHSNSTISLMSVVFSGLDPKIHHTRVHVNHATVLNAANCRVGQVAFANAARWLGWDDGIVSLAGEPFAKTIVKQKNADGKHLFTSPDNRPITAVACSRCGHYGAIASQAGLVSVFSMQSGRLKCEFEGPLNPIMVSFDAVSRRVIVVGQEGQVMIKSILNLSSPVAMFDVESAVKKAHCLIDANLVFILSAEDFSIFMFDVDSNKVVRRLEATEGAMVSDFSVTADSKWLLSTTTNKSVQLWDLVSGLMIGSIQTDRPIRSIATSPDGQFVSTVSMGCNYADLWWFLPQNHLSLTAPSMTTLTDNTSEDELVLQMSVSRFSTFINWQSLKEMNKPKIPVKKASTAPFFLSELARQATTVQTSDIGTNDNQEIMQSLSADTTVEEAKQFLLSASVNQIHDEIALSSSNQSSTFATLTNALNELSRDPKLFDRCLALSTVMLLQSPSSASAHQLLATTDNLSQHWHDCHDLMHGCLNVIRANKGHQ